MAAKKSATKRAAKTAPKTKRAASTTRKASPAKRGAAGAKKTARKSERGTAAGMRAGAASRTEAKEMTADTGKQSRKTLTKRGGPGRAGTSPNASRAGTGRKRTATRGRGDSARTGA
jgi:hypothetical protein